MRKIILILSVFFLPYPAIPQNANAVAGNKLADRPKLVIAIVIDQMRWDYLYRYFDSHIPLIWYGWNVHAGKTNREV
jgi:predicted AlkP superfamily pyrophosphatase or phosphodiesterase